MNYYMLSTVESIFENGFVCCGLQKLIRVELREIEYLLREIEYFF